MYTHTLHEHEHVHEMRQQVVNINKCLNIT